MLRASDLNHMEDGIVEAGKKDSGRYELIETFTATEGEKKFWKTKEPDGKPYDFTAAIIKVVAPTGAANAGIALYGGSEIAGSGTRIFDASLSLGENNHTGSVIAYRGSGLWDVTGWNSSPSTDFLQDPRTVVEPVELSSAPSITQIREWKDLVPGTVVTIKAIRRA